MKNGLLVVDQTETGNVGKGKPVLYISFTMWFLNLIHRYSKTFDGKIFPGGLYIVVNLVKELLNIKKMTH